MKCETAILQNEIEFAWFIEILKREKVTSYLEIGGKHGGSLWRVCRRAMPGGARVVCVDLPHGDTSFKESQPNLEQCVERLKLEGYDAHLFLGDSTNPGIVQQVRALSPFDCCFIDANHTERYVRQDWANYGPMCRIVAFHDIGWLARPEPSKKMPIEVPIVWNELKTQYRHEEIKLEPRDNGIGVLWRS